MNTKQPTIYRIDAFTVDAIKEQIAIGDAKYRVRPKTFAVLKLLLKSPGQTISKQKFLDEIWSDVCVDEQVLIQSIKELRKLFAPTEVIKTYPRVGYAWIAKTTTKHPGYWRNFNPLFALKNTKLPIAASFTATICVALAFAVMSFSLPNSNKLDNHKNTFASSIIILPVNTTLTGNDRRWVRFGAMSQLSESLKENSSINITQGSELPFEIKEINNFYGETELENIQRLTYADFIVESRLGGMPGDYELMYKIHTQQTTYHGVVFSYHQQQAFEQLSERILEAEKNLMSLNYDMYSSTLYSSVDDINNGHYQQAYKQLARLYKNNSADPIIAKLIIDLDIKLEMLQQAQIKTDNIIKVLSNNSDIDSRRKLGRFKFIQSKILLEQGRYQDSLKSLNSAFEYAQETIDVPNQSRIHELSGAIHISEKNYTKAETAFIKAAQHYEVLQCPYGVALVNLSLANIAYLKKDTEKAIDYATHALSVSVVNDLKDIQIKTKETINHYKTELNLI